MKILFVMRSTVYLRNFESTIRLLADRGHDVHVVGDVHYVLDPSDLVGRMGRDNPRITAGPPPERQANRWTELGYALRRGLDYLRYLEPEYKDAPKLRYRAQEKAPALLLNALKRPLAATRVGRVLIGGLLRALNRAVPRDPTIDAFVEAQRPDLLLVTPLVEPGSPQTEYLRSARALGIPVGLCVYSWDNLTNKGLIHEPLDVVTVWNDAMKSEAVTLHHVPSARVVVTGSPAYDHWFSWKPSTTRQAFCASVGLDPAQPYLLYLCSSRFIAPDEVPFIRRWIEETRRASPTLRDAGVLVRPHPQFTDAWDQVTLDDLPNVVVWPKTGGNPVDSESRSGYFDSIHHSAAVVGINTSAQIESAIVGRPVHTVLADEFRDTQEGTLHFRHLREVNGGLLQVAADFPEHVSQLETSLAHPEAAAERCRRFVAAFVRPWGLDQPAAPRVVAALESAVAPGRRPAARAPWWSGLAQPLLGRLASAIDYAERQRPRKAKRSTRPWIVSR